MIGAIARSGIVAAAVVAVAGSASAPKPHTVIAKTEIDAGFDPTWTAVIDLFAERGWAIRTTEKASGLIATDWMELGPKYDVYCDCGGSGIASTPSTQIKFNVRVKEESGHSEVHVNASFRQVRTFDGRSGMVECTSRGTIEREVHEEVDGRVKRAPKRRPVAAPDQPPSKHRGFYCASSPTVPAVSSCAREKSVCESTRSALAVATPDVTACRLVESVVCFDAGTGNPDERCSETDASCEAQRRTLLASSPDSKIGDCVEDR